MRSITRNIRAISGAPVGLRFFAARTLTIAGFALICGLPLSSSLAKQSATDAEAIAPQSPLQSSQQSPFAEQFREIIEPLGPDYQDAHLNIPENAVDLETFEPPVDTGPPEPSIIRSLGTGIASYYGRRFHGRRTANGERFDMNAMTAAHKTLPFGTLVRVTNQRNGRAVTVRINDRGPFIRGRTIDLSRGAAEQIGMIARGHARVAMDIVTP